MVNESMKYTDSQEDKVLARVKRVYIMPDDPRRSQNSHVEKLPQAETLYNNIKQSIQDNYDSLARARDRTDEFHRFLVRYNSRQVEINKLENTSPKQCKDS